MKWQYPECHWADRLGPIGSDSADVLVRPEYCGRGAQSWIRQLTTRTASTSRSPHILLTHLPVSSPSETGKLPDVTRDKAEVSTAAGESISASVSETLLKQIAPRMVVSASSGQGKMTTSGGAELRTPELSGSGFSYQSALGERGYQLLSLYNPLDKDGVSINKDASTIEYVQCGLPHERHLLQDTCKMLTLCCACA